MDVSLIKKNPRFIYSSKKKLLSIIKQSLKILSLDKIDKKISFVLVDKQEIMRLNKCYLNHKGATDVITFDYQKEKESPIYAESFICLDTTFKQAKIYKNEFNTELVLYIVHSLLHLLGYNDKTSKKREIMRKQENNALQILKKKFNCFKTLKLKNVL